MVHRTRNLLLALLVIGVVLTSLFGLTYIPNPLIKKYPWVGIDYVRIDAERWQDTTIFYFMMLIIIHNPTHQIYHIERILANLTALITHGSLALVPFEQEYHATTEKLEVFAENGIFTPSVFPIELEACTPIAGILVFTSSQPFRSFTFLNFDKGMFHLDLSLTINGGSTTLTNELTVNFASVSEQTTTATTATSTRTGLPPKPYECLLPWV